jgi:hypothetical protein
MSFPARETTHRRAAAQCNPYVVDTNAAAFFTTGGPDHIVVGGTAGGVHQEEEFFQVYLTTPITNFQPTLIADVCTRCSQALATEKRTITNNDDIKKLMTWCILRMQCTNNKDDNDLARDGHFLKPSTNIVAHVHVAADAQGAQGTQEQRYSITFTVTPHLQVPFAVLMPRGHIEKVGNGGWRCTAAPAAGALEQPIFFVGKENFAKRPANSAPPGFLLAEAAARELKTQKTAAMDVIANAAKAPAASALPTDAGAGGEAGDGVLPPLLLPPQEPGKGPHTFPGAAGGGGHVRHPKHQKYPYAVSDDPSAETGKEHHPFAAFFLDPVKHANLIGYLDLQTLFEPHTLHAHNEQVNSAGTEQINNVSSRIIDALPTVTFYQALESNQTMNANHRIFHHPTKLDEQNPVDMSFETRPWQEQYFFEHIQGQTEHTAANIEQDSSTTPALAISKLPSLVVNSQQTTTLNFVVLRFISTHDHQQQQQQQQQQGETVQQQQQQQQQQPEGETFFLCYDDFHDNSNAEKYLVAYKGRMHETIDAIRNDLSHTAATQCFKTYERYWQTYLRTYNSMNVQSPWALLPSGMTLGVHYWKCPKTTDGGFWHDHAHDILCDVDSRHAFVDQNKQRKLHNFILVIAKRLFSVPLPTNPKLSYVFQSTHHRVVVGEEFHVIIRLENGQSLIFYTGKNAPKHCSPCSLAEALDTFASTPGHYV